MHPNEQIADEIRSVLNSGNDPSVEVMQSLDRRLNDAITDVNERLHHCSTLLDSGLRTEAIQQCESEPNLLEMVAVLDFPEMEVWSDYAKQFGLPGPPKILGPIAEQLNDAYNEESSLADLLRQHRLHALLRSPLPTRLNILRSLAHRDSGTPIWQDDIKSYESVRHNQLREEIHGATQAADIEKLASLEQEAQSSAWLVPPPKEIVDAAVSAHTRLRVKRARKQLEGLVDDLTEAFSNFDLDQGRQLRERWHAQEAIAMGSDISALRELVDPALMWLEEMDGQETQEQEYQKTLTELEEALDQGATRTQLETLYYNLQQFDREIPAVLLSRLTERFALLDLAQKRKSRLITLGAVSVVLLIGGVCCWAIFAYQKGLAFESMRSGLEELVKGDNLELANKRVEDIRTRAPNEFQRTEIQNLVSQLREKESSEQSRRTLFRQHLDSALECGKNFNRFGEANSHISSAEKLASGVVEQGEVAKVRKEVNDLRSKMQGEIDAPFIAALTSFTDACKQVDPHDLETLQQLVLRGSELVSDSSVSKEYRTQVSPLVKNLEARIETEERYRLSNQRIAAVDGAVGNRGDFLNALNKYRSDFPDTALSHQVGRVLDNELSTWDSVLAWNQFIETWGERDLRYIKPASAAKLIDEANALMQEHPGFPGTEHLQTLIEFLGPITKRIEEDGTPSYAALTTILNENIPTLNMALVSVDDSYARYYYRTGTQLQITNETYRIDYFIDMQFSDTKIARLAPDVFRNPMDDSGNAVWLAPQTQFAREALKLFDRFDEMPWEGLFYELLKAIDRHPAMAPQVRVQLLQLVLKHGCQGSQPMTQAYRWHLEQLNLRQIQSRPIWVDPLARGNDVVETNEKANRLLGDLGFITLRDDSPRKPIVNSAMETKKLLDQWKSAELAAKYRWVGWLRQDSSGEGADAWSLVINPKRSPESADAKAWVIYPSDDETKKPIFETVGTISEERITIKPDSQAALVSGRPVFTLSP